MRRGKDDGISLNSQSGSHAIQDFSSKYGSIRIEHSYEVISANRVKQELKFLIIFILIRVTK